MRSVVLKSQFRRDFKKWVEGQRSKASYERVMERIAGGEPLEPRHRDHPLHGAWQGCRDCHVRGDVVLIYSLSPGLAVFHRVGSHSELFRRCARRWWGSRAHPFSDCIKSILREHVRQAIRRID